MNRIGKKELYRVKLPVRTDLKNWVKKWLGQTSDEVEVRVGVTDIGDLVQLACVSGSPGPADKFFSSADFDDFIYVVIPVGTYIPDEKIIQLNQALYSYLISQIVTVALARKQADNLKTPQSAVFEYYQSFFGIEMSTHALEKASQRVRSTRNIPRFMMRK